MTCGVSNMRASLPDLRAVAKAAALVAVVALGGQGVEAARGWLAGSMNVPPHDYSWGQLISLKGAVENGDPFRATRIMVEAGQRPDPFVWQPALTGLTTEYLGS